MDDVPYDDWCAYLVRLLKKYGCEDCLVAELGCGTGNMTERLAAAGYDMTGIDSSEDMLNEALLKRDESGSDILYLLQDMREFELFGTMRAIVSVCDSMNYITEYDDLVKVLRLVNNYLDPGGVFIFDLNTEYKYREIIGDRTIAETREHESFIWENSFDEETGINEYDLTLFTEFSGGGKESLYRRHEEIHYQRAYSVDEITAAAKEAGMDVLAFYDAFTEDEIKPDSERICVVLGEKCKTGHGKI